MEEETKGKLPFFDTLVERKGTSVSTTVYRKPTHTSRHIYFTSHHHPRVLRGVVKCLKDRADNICMGSTETHELTHLKKVFKANGYPDQMLNQILHQTKCRRPLPPPLPPPVDVKPAKEKEKEKLLFTPYVRGLSEKIEKICYQLGIKAVFKSGNTLRGSLMRVKNRKPDELKRGAVYEVPCGECDRSYIGETGRCLKERLKEHQYAVRTGNMNNGIAAHAWSSQHSVNWDEARVLVFEQHQKRRRVLEAIRIQRNGDRSSNLDYGLHLNHHCWSEQLTLLV